MCETYKVNRIRGKVFFSGAVTPDSMNELKLSLEEAVSEVSSNRGVGVTLYIDSPGGDTRSAFGMADYIEKELDHDLGCVVTGLCASAAVLLAMSCDFVFMTRNSTMMIHEGYASAYQLRDEDFMRFSDYLKNTLRERAIKFYAEHIYQNAERPATEEEIRAEIVNDVWMDAEEARRRGFVHGIR